MFIIQHLACLIVSTVALKVNVTFNTPKQVDDNTIPGDQYDFYPLSSIGYSVNTDTSVLFHVKACSNAHVLLKANGFDFYAVIGGYDNKRVDLYSTLKGAMTDPIATKFAEVLDCAMYLTFNISWIDGNFQVWKKNGTWELIVEGIDQFPSDVNVNDVAVSSGIWDTATWKIPVADYKVSSNTKWTIGVNNGIKMTNGIIWRKYVRTLGKCAVVCHLDIYCWSFTFDRADMSCQGHMDIYMSQTDGEGELSLSSSYYIYTMK